MDDHYCHSCQRGPTMQTSADRLYHEMSSGEGELNRYIGGSQDGAEEGDNLYSISTDDGPKSAYINQPEGDNRYMSGGLSKDGGSNSVSYMSNSGLMKEESKSDLELAISKDGKEAKPDAKETKISEPSFSVELSMQSYFFPIKDEAEAKKEEKDEKDDAETSKEDKPKPTGLEDKIDVFSATKVTKLSTRRL